MTITLSELETAGIRLESSDEHALVYDVFDAEGRKLTRAEFLKMYSHILYQMEAEPFDATKEKVCAEGDSWINILWPFSSIGGYQASFFDIIQKSKRYTTLDLAWPGDTLKSIVTKKEYQQPLQSKTYDYFIFSAAGNDVLGGKALKNILKPRSEINPSEPVESWINEAKADKAYGFVRQSYKAIADEVDKWSEGKTKMFIHGYDYPVPRFNGKWLGKPLAERGYDLIADAALIEKLMHYVVNRLYSDLGKVSASFNGVILLDLRNSVKGRWHDELHPQEAASRDIAEVFMAEMSLTA